MRHHVGIRIDVHAVRDATWEDVPSQALHPMILLSQNPGWSTISIHVLQVISRCQWQYVATGGPLLEATSLLSCSFACASYRKAGRYICVWTLEENLGMRRVWSGDSTTAKHRSTWMYTSMSCPEWTSNALVRLLKPESFTFAYPLGTWDISSSGMSTSDVDGHTRYYI